MIRSLTAGFRSLGVHWTTSVSNALLATRAAPSTAFAARLQSSSLLKTGKELPGGSDDLKKESEVDSALEEVLEADLMPAYAHKEAYSMEAIAKLKLDQYPFYVEREWWKKGKRMTFWATWRQNRDVNRRELLEKLGPDRMRLKALKWNTVLPQAIRDQAAEELHNMPKYSRPRLILNMCMFTGRQRGKIKPYRLNRHLFRKFADHSQLSGVQRAMW